MLEAHIIPSKAMMVGMGRNKRKRNVGMKKTIRILTALVLGIMVYASCGGKKIENPYVYYDELVNGNKVVIVLDRHVIDGNFADARILLCDDSNTWIVRQPIYIGEFLELFGKDFKNAVAWNYYYDETKGPHLDWRTIVAFDDYDFDGEKELAVCGYPRPFREGVERHWLDCEDFTFYKLTQYGYTEIKNKAFDELAGGLCRTHYDFDTINRTLTLISVESASEVDTSIYYFQDGEIVDVITNTVEDEKDLYNAVLKAESSEDYHENMKSSVIEAVLPFCKSKTNSAAAQAILDSARHDDLESAEAILRETIDDFISDKNICGNKELLSLLKCLYVIYSTYIGEHFAAYMVCKRCAELVNYMVNPTSDAKEILSMADWRFVISVHAKNGKQDAYTKLLDEYSSWIIRKYGEYSIEAKKSEAIRVIANDEYLYWQRYYGPIDDSLCE